MKGDVALETHQRPGTCQGGLVQGGATGTGGDKTRASGLLVSGDDGPGTALLSGQGLVVPGDVLLGVGPHRVSTIPGGWQGPTPARP